MTNTPTYNPQIHHRRSIRLKGYDYSQAGMYFVTICCKDRECRFGRIENDEMILNDAGKNANECWLEIPNHFPNAILHEHIVMPNHVHGIIELLDVANVGVENRSSFNVGAENFLPQQNTSPLVGVENFQPLQQHNELKQHEFQNLPQQNTSPLVGVENFHPLQQHNELNQHEFQNLPQQNTSPLVGVENFHPLQQHNELKQHEFQKMIPRSIGSIVKGFKIGVTKWFRNNSVGVNNDLPLQIWQRNYYEHIIRNEQSYQKISEYIINNPSLWKEDKFYK
jgi:putative transposase